MTRESRAELTPGETRQFRELGRQIDELRAEMTRAGYDDPDSAAVLRGGPRTDGWANRAADAMLKMGGETRAVTSGSIDIASLIEAEVTPKARPARLLDLLVNRKPLDGNSFEYYRQTVRTNNAAPVADSAQKPTSVFTVAAITDRARVVAHLSEAVPLRLLADHDELVRFLEDEMRQGVLDALEAQILAGPGTGETFTGVTVVAGTTAVAYDTSVVKTLRNALTATQIAGEMPTAWVMHPSDVAATDLTLQTSGNGFLLDGYQTGNAGSGNVFGDGIPRVVSPSCPVGYAILADWSRIRLYVREDVRIDVDTSGAALFDYNLGKMRAEGRFGLGYLRPSSIFIADLTP
ncbi:hypothetical protein TUM20984_50150 [Mycobacterium antarcticum]|nr:hypothetical protein TUM20984_50150 [Mycolicibacterium sp. TUM20984]